MIYLKAWDDYILWVLKQYRDSNKFISQKVYIK